MSGHSKWHTIKHKKGAADAKRGKVFTRIIKELTVAARSGGGDPDMNPRLRTVIADAKQVNMPADNIKRAIRRGTGEEEGVNYEEVTYEGYGPGGVAVLIETLTDNKNRTVGEIRHTFTKWGGKLGEPNSVARMFHKKGLIVVDKDKASEEALMEAVLDAGADDMKDDGERLGNPVGAGCAPGGAGEGEGDGHRADDGRDRHAADRLRQARGQARSADAEAGGRARGARRHQERLVELRHRGTGNRGLAGVRVFGIDPGSVRTGYGCVETDGRRHTLVACGAIAPAPGAALPDRLQEIHDRLRELIDRHRPECVAIENLFHAKNVKSALVLGHARGVAVLAAVEAGLPIVEYSPAAIKASVVGYGRADKHQMQQMVKLLLGLDAVPTPHDAADALAVAICHVHTRGPRGAGGRRAPRGRRAICAAGGTRSSRTLDPAAGPVIAHLTGTLLEKHLQRLIVDVGGVGYDVTVPLSTIYALGEMGSRVDLRIHTHVREDVLQLFGFATPLEQTLFERLISVSGIGPKVALADPVRHRAGRTHARDPFVRRRRGSPGFPASARRRPSASCSS